MACITPLLLAMTFLAGPTTQFTAPFTTPFITTPITTPGVPPGGCLYDGVVYQDGDSISRDPDSCYGVTCMSGSATQWDDKCNFKTPECPGIQRKVAGQCCPDCLTTTVPPTTTSPTTIPVPPDGCVVDKKTYQNGEKIQTDFNYCGGTMCQYGQVIYWDHHCMFYTPACAGISYPIPGECCPGCNLTTTTLPTTIPTTRTTTPTVATNGSSTIPTSTKIPQNGCLYIGKVYKNYDKIPTSPDGCHGYECHYGAVRAWKHGPCLPDEACTGTLVNVTGQCCPRCVPGDNVTLECNINGKKYIKGAVIKVDVCNVCRCGDAGEQNCTQVRCPVLDCDDVKMRYQGECCFTCGTSSVTLTWWTMMLTGVAAFYWI